MNATGPAVVAVGGGHGLAATLRAVRAYAGELTAVVSVADDGGSSGRLRRQLGIIPPGDLRVCLVALAEPGSALAAAFDHRFDGDELGGHALGNLVIAGLLASCGDPQAGLDEAGRLLGAVGRVVPATTEPVVLKAVADGGEIEGQRRSCARRTSTGCRSCPPTRPPRPRRWLPWPTPTRSSSGPDPFSRASWRPWRCPVSPRPSGAHRGAGSTWPTSVPRGRRPSATTWPPRGRP